MRTDTVSECFKQSYSIYSVIKTKTTESWKARKSQESRKSRKNGKLEDSWTGDRKMTEIISVISLFKRNCQVESNKVEQKYLDTSCIHLIIILNLFRSSSKLLRQFSVKYY